MRQQSCRFQKRRHSRRGGSFAGAWKAAAVAAALHIALAANAETVVFTDRIPFTMTGHTQAAPGTPVRIFVVFGIITHIVLYFMYHGMLKAEKKRFDPPQTAVARPANAGVPQKQPLLQPFPQVPSTDTTASTREPYQNTPVTDMQDMRAAEDLVLKNYGWVDKQHGVVRIPIEQAKGLLAAKLALEGQRATTTTTTTTTATTTGGAQ